MNRISYVVFGNDPRYTEGICRNVDAFRSNYPGWEMCVYTELASVPTPCVNYLKQRGARVFECAPPMWATKPKMWRLGPLDMPDTDIVLFRDADSRFTKRQIAAEKEWIESEFGAHVMRDYPHHSAGIMGGMWGIKKSKFPGLSVTGLWEWYITHVADWGHDSDQVFLNRLVWPRIRNDCLQHDEFSERHGARPFPVKFDPKEGFVGEAFDGKDASIHTQAGYRRDYCLCRQYS